LVRSWSSGGVHSRCALSARRYEADVPSGCVCQVLGRRRNERGPFRGSASWPNPYLVRRYNDSLSYGHNILAECSGNVMRMCGFGGYSRTCSPPSWIDRGRALEDLSAQKAIVRFTVTSELADGNDSLRSGWKRSKRRQVLNPASASVSLNLVVSARL